MTAFAPDDEDDPSGRRDRIESDVDTDAEKLADFNTSQNHMDPTRVDVDPMLFGEFPDSDIEQVPVEYVDLSSAEQQHRWNRQVTLVSMLDACVECDGPIRTREMESPSGDTIVKYKCTDCGEAWVNNEDQNITSHR